MARLLPHSAGLWHVAKGFLVGHYLRCGGKLIALISSAIISSGQTGAEPTEAGRLASLLLTYLHCLTDSLFAHFHCGNKIRSNYKVPGFSVHNISRWAAQKSRNHWHKTGQGRFSESVAHLLVGRRDKDVYSRAPSVWKCDLVHFHVFFYLDQRREQFIVKIWKTPAHSVIQAGSLCCWD